MNIVVCMKQTPDTEAKIVLQAGGQDVDKNNFKYMSRIGKKPVILTNGITAELKDLHLTIKGSKGSLEMDIHPKVMVEVKDGEVTVDVAKKEDKREKALWGLSSAKAARRKSLNCEPS